MASLSIAHDSTEVLRSGSGIPDAQTGRDSSEGCSDVSHLPTHIFRAQSYDLVDVAEMWTSLGQEEGHKITTSDKVEFMAYHLAMIGYEELYIYHDDEGTKGFIFFTVMKLPYSVPKDIVVVNHLFVKKKFRSSGVASALLKQIPHNVTIQVATPNVAFWKSMGFHKTLTVMEK